MQMRGVVAAALRGHFLRRRRRGEDRDDPIGGGLRIGGDIARRLDRIEPNGNLIEAGEALRDQGGGNRAFARSHRRKRVFDRVQRINLRGTFIIDQQAARRVRSGGAIINFSTSMTRLQQPSYGAYAASKGAVEALTLILARELRGRDVTVNAVAPGPTATPLFLDGKPQELVDHIASVAPLERLGTPEDIAEMVSFLAGPARWVNGQVLYTNGGVA